MEQTTRWRRRKEARPTEIIDAALAVFAERGYAATRMDDIAARAGVTKGTIYLYFQSKDAIFRELVQGSIGASLETARAAMNRFEGASADLLRLILRGLGRFVMQSDRVVLPKLMIAEAGNFPALAEFYRHEVIDRGLGLFQFVIARGIERGEFRPVEPAHAARLAVAPLLIVTFWRTTFARFDSAPYDYEGFIETHIETLLRGLTGGNP